MNNKNVKSSVKLLLLLSATCYHSL